MNSTTLQELARYAIFFANPQSRNATSWLRPSKTKQTSFGDQNDHNIKNFVSTSSFECQGAGINSAVLTLQHLRTILERLVAVSDQ